MSSSTTVPACISTSSSPTSQSLSSSCSLSSSFPSSIPSSCKTFFELSAYSPIKGYSTAYTFVSRLDTFGCLFMNFNIIFCPFLNRIPHVSRELSRYVSNKNQVNFSLHRYLASNRKFVMGTLVLPL